MYVATGSGPDAAMLRWMSVCRLGAAPAAADGAVDGALAELCGCCIGDVLRDVLLLGLLLLLTLPLPLLPLLLLAARRGTAQAARARRSARARAAPLATVRRSACMTG
jgi:hypothetical protein